jgi:hypothetical protein
VLVYQESKVTTKPSSRVTTITAAITADLDRCPFAEHVFKLHTVLAGMVVVEVSSSLSSPARLAALPSSLTLSRL